MGFIQDQFQPRKGNGRVLHRGVQGGGICRTEKVGAGRVKKSDNGIYHIPINLTKGWLCALEKRKHY